MKMFIRIVNILLIVLLVLLFNAAPAPSQETDLERAKGTLLESRGLALDE